MAVWQISGESGAALGAALVDMDAYGIEGAKISLGSLYRDRLTFSQVFNDVADAALYPIDGKQRVTLWRDGVRFFQGIVTAKPAGNTVGGGVKINYTVSGVWWELEKTPMSGDVNDQTGGTKTRIMYALDTGDIKAHLTTIINRAAALGVNIAVGAMDDTFDIPQITLKQGSCAAAIVEVMGWLPDAMVWIDYTGATPAFRMARRDVAAVTTFTQGVAPLHGWSVNPRYELECEQVTVTYVKRALDGRTVYMEQISGHDGTAQSGGGGTIKLAADASDADDAYKGLDVEIISGTGAGQTREIIAYVGSSRIGTVDPSWTTSPDATSVYKVGGGSGTALNRQIFTVSGPELDSFLPNDLFDSYDGDGESATTNAGIRELVVVQPLMADAVQDGMPTSALECPATSALTKQWAQNTSHLPGTNGSSYTVPAAIYKRLDGTTFSPTGKSILIGDTPPEWLREQLGLEEISISGWWTYTFLYNDYYSSANHYGTLPSWWYLLPGDMQLLYSGYTGTSSTYKLWRLYGGQWEARAWVASSIPAGTIYRDADYGFLYPPDGLAENLRKTQAFTPYSGEIQVPEYPPGGTEYRGKVVNINGALPEHAAMKALCQGMDITLATGEQTLKLGVPERLNYLGLVNRFRRTASDNIVYL